MATPENSETEEFVERAKTQLNEYIQLRTELFKADVTDKLAQLASKMIAGLLLGFLLLFVLLFSSIALGFYLGNSLNNIAFGFLIVAGIYFLFLVIILLLKKRIIETRVGNLIVRIIYNNSDED